MEMKHYFLTMHTYFTDKHLIYGLSNFNEFIPVVTSQMSPDVFALLP